MAAPVGAGSSSCAMARATGPARPRSGLASTTNVYKLFTLLAADEIQTTWYQAGVGSDTSSTARQVRRTKAILGAIGANAGSQVAAYGDRLVKLVESAFGTGISEGIVNGYAEIVRQYRPGDRIYLCGFSRGAYTARCIAGVISKVGLLRAEHGRYAPEMVQLYRNRADQHAKVAVRPCTVHDDPAIEFVGVFDTVASLGVPLWGWWFRVLPIWKLGPLADRPGRGLPPRLPCAVDGRAPLGVLPDPLHRPAAALRWTAQRPTTSLRRCSRSGSAAPMPISAAATPAATCPTSPSAGCWTRCSATASGSATAPGTTLRPDPLGPLHDELERNPGWVLFGSWPRWHPTPGAVPDSNGTTLHRSVLERAATVEARTGRPDLVRLRTRRSPGHRGRGRPRTGTAPGS